MNELDAKRRSFGLPPIFVTPPRPLTQAEREGHDDVIVRAVDGSVARHFVPMIENGWLIYVDVFRAECVEAVA